jgi:PST family polysaccharide transporter
LLDGNSLTGLATLLALSYSSYLIAIMYFAPKRALAKRLLRYGYGKTAAQI